MIYKFIIAIAFTLAFQSVQAAEKKELTLVGPEFEPYYFSKEDGSIDGQLVNLYALILENAGYKWNGIIVPAKRVMRLLAQGIYQSSILVNNPILEESGNVLTSKNPVSQMVLNAYHSDTNPQIKTKQRLIGKRVIVMRGYGYGGIRKWLELKENNIELMEVNSFSSAIKMIEFNRADYALLYDVNFSAGEIALKRKADGLIVSNITNVPLYLHLNKKTLSHPQKIMDDLMSSYQELVKKGILAPAQTRPEWIIRSPSVKY